MNREANFRQVVKTTRATDVPPLGEEIETYGDVRRDAILWAAEEIEQMRAVYVAAQRVVRQTNCTTAYLLHDQLIQAIEAVERREEAT